MIDTEEKKMGETTVKKDVTQCADGIYEIGRDIFGIGKLLSYVQESEEQHNGIQASHLRVLEKQLYGYSKQLLEIAENL